MICLNMYSMAGPPGACAAEGAAGCVWNRDMAGGKEEEEMGEKEKRWTRTDAA